MITYHNGDLLESGCNIICHQVNLQGVMGGGLALKIAKKYPECEKEYAKDAKESNALGKARFYRVDENHFIANCFTQDKDFNTDYGALIRAFMTIHDVALLCKMTVGIPYKYGRGIAHGDWESVKLIITAIFDKSEVECQIWKYEV